MARHPSSATGAPKDRVTPAEGTSATKNVAPVAPAEAPNAPAAVHRVGAAAPVDRTSAADRVARVEGAGEVAPVNPVAPAALPQAVAAVAARLRRGEITAPQAVDLLIDDAIRGTLADLPAGPGADKVVEELRALLQDYSRDNPLLAARVRRLTTIR